MRRTSSYATAAISRTDTPARAAVWPEKLDRATRAIVMHPGQPHDARPKRRRLSQSQVLHRPVFDKLVRPQQGGKQKKIPHKAGFPPVQDTPILLLYLIFPTIATAEKVYQILTTLLPDCNRYSPF